MRCIHCHRREPAPGSRHCKECAERIAEILACLRYLNSQPKMLVQKEVKNETRR